MAQGDTLSEQATNEEIAQAVRLRFEALQAAENALQGLGPKGREADLFKGILELVKELTLSTGVLLDVAHLQLTGKHVKENTA